MPLNTTAGDIALNQLTSLPLGQLMGQVLKSGIEAEALAAETTVDFIKTVGFENVNGKLNAIYLEFLFEDGSGVYRRLRIPMIMAVKPPLLTIADLNYQFKAKIDASAQQATSESLQNSFSTGGSFSHTSTSKGNFGISTKKLNFGVSNESTHNINLYANFSSKRDSKATQDSKYSVEYTVDIDVHAQQAGLPQGLAALLNILQEGISTRPLQTQINVFGLSAVNKLTSGGGLTDTSFYVLVLDDFGEPVNNAIVELTSEGGLIDPDTTSSGTNGVYTVALGMPTGTTLTGDADETLNITVTTGVSPNEEVAAISRKIMIAL